MLATIFTGRRKGVDIEPFYIGPGFATIQNFTKGQDRIQLGGYGGYFLDPYILIPTNNNRDLAIQTNGGDTIAVIEGGGNLKLNLLPEFSFGTLLLG